MQKSELLPLALGLAAALATGLAAALLAGAAFTFAPLPDAYFKPGVAAAYFLGAFSGGTVAARKARRKGILYGAGTGVLYFFSCLLVGLLASTGTTSLSRALLEAVATLAAAGLGGAFGIFLAE